MNINLLFVVYLLVLNVNIIITSNLSFNNVVKQKGKISQPFKRKDEKQKF